jgi:hypothetical protein
VTLLAWKCGSHLHRPQKLDIHLHTTGFEHEAAKMARVNKGLRARSSLPSGKGQCSYGCAESQGSLQLFTGGTSYWERVQHTSITISIIVQHHPHNHIDGRDHYHIEE